METFIDQTVHAVLGDFRKTVQNTGRLCACKDLTYEKGHSPDYGNLLVQQSYMLRFFPAYLAEYFLMYRKMLDTKFLPNDLVVLSIGCGCGVDLWGLKFAVSNYGTNPRTCIDYTGIDIAEWRYRNTMGIPRVRFLTQDIGDWKVLDRSDYNVIVFPKCINELPDNVFNSICDMLANTTFNKGKICALCSIMTKGGKADILRFKKIAEVIETRCGFQCLDDVDKFWAYDKDQGLRKVCPSFVYPNDVVKTVNAFSSECPTRSRNGKPCETDCDCLNRSPILTTQFLKYQFLRFERLPW